MPIAAFLQKLFNKAEPATVSVVHGDAEKATESVSIARPVRAADENVHKILKQVRSKVSSDFSLPDEDWIKQSGPFKSAEAFFNSSFNNFGELLRYTDIKPDSRVLDYGCGLGRLAIPLSAYLAGPQGSYRGIDTDADCIARNQEIFAGYPNFDFEHVNLYSKMYNKEGQAFETLAGRDFGGPFDLAFLFSVFTHILPEHCDLLLQILRAQLCNTGQVFSSWFLLNEDTERAIKAGTASRKFAFKHGAARIDHPKVPEGAVAYFESDVLERFARAGLADVRIEYGDWRGKQGNNVWQDIIVAGVTQ